MTHELCSSNLATEPRDPRPSVASCSCVVRPDRACISRSNHSAQTHDYLSITVGFPCTIRADQGFARLMTMRWNIDRS